MGLPKPADAQRVFQRLCSSAPLPCRASVFLLISSSAFPAVACLPAALRLRLAVLGFFVGGSFADSFRVLLVRLCRRMFAGVFRVGEDRLINVNCIVNKYFFLLIYKIKKIPPKREERA